MEACSTSQYPNLMWLMPPKNWLNKCMLWIKLIGLRPNISYGALNTLWNMVSFSTILNHYTELPTRMLIRKTIVKVVLPFCGIPSLPRRQFISLCSKKQQTVASSFIEVEYWFFASVATKKTWVINLLLLELVIYLKGPSVILFHHSTSLPS